MTDKVSKTSTFAAFILFFINFIVLVLSALFFIFSLWIIASPTSLSAAIEGFGTPAMKSLLPQEVLTVDLGLSIAGGASFFLVISLMGLHGAVGRSPFLLFMYSALVVLLLLLECALFYYFSSSVTEKGVQQRDGQWTHALRLAFKCCENNYTRPAPQAAVPWSCCGTSGFPANCSANGVYADDCNKKIAVWLDRYETAIYVSLAVVHLILLSCSIVRRSRSSSRSYS